MLSPGRGLGFLRRASISGRGMTDPDAFLPRLTRTYSPSPLRCHQLAMPDWAQGDLRDAMAHGTLENLHDMYARKMCLPRTC